MLLTWKVASPSSPDSIVNITPVIQIRCVQSNFAALLFSANICCPNITSIKPCYWLLQMLEVITPGADEIVLPKTCSSVFQSTNINYLLHNIGVRQLLLCGCLTDQCVEHAVRDACDLGFLVTLVSGEEPSCQDWFDTQDKHKIAGQALLNQGARNVQLHAACNIRSELFKLYCSTSCMPQRLITSEAR